MHVPKTITVNQQIHPTDQWDTHVAQTLSPQIARHSKYNTLVQKHTVVSGTTSHIHYGSTSLCLKDSDGLRQIKVSNWSDEFNSKSHAVSHQRGRWPRWFKAKRAPSSFE